MIEAGSRVLPLGNHRHATVIAVGTSHALVRCDCTTPFIVALVDTEETPDAPIDVEAIGPGRSATSHGGPKT